MGQPEWIPRAYTANENATVAPGSQAHWAAEHEGHQIDYWNKKDQILHTASSQGPGADDRNKRQSVSIEWDRKPGSVDEYPPRLNLMSDGWSRVPAAEDAYQMNDRLRKSEMETEWGKWRMHEVRVDAANRGLQAGSLGHSAYSNISTPLFKAAAPAPQTRVDTDSSKGLQHLDQSAWESDVQGRIALELQV